MRILREKRLQTEELGFKKENQIRKMEQEFKRTLQVEIGKRRQLSIEARVMFADLKKMAPFNSPKSLAVELEPQLDYEFPKRAKVKELLNTEKIIRLESIDICHKSSYDALYGLRLNFTNGVSTELIKTQAYRKDPPKNYKINQSKCIGRVGARVDNQGEIYGLRFQEASGASIISINWVDQGQWVDLDVPSGSSIIGFYCRTTEIGPANLDTSTTSARSGTSSPTKKKPPGGKELKTLQDLGFSLWKWS